jgi:hypothetical protein
VQSLNVSQCRSRLVDWLTYAEAIQLECLVITSVMPLALVHELA